MELDLLKQKILLKSIFTTGFDDISQLSSAKLVYHIVVKSIVLLGGAGIFGTITMN
jgi:hypothetical protein